MTKIVVYVTDTLADWELGYVLPGLAMANGTQQRFDVVTAGTSTDPVTTKGDLTVVPATALSDIDPASIDLLIMPGADTWGEGHDEVLALASDLVVQEQPSPPSAGRRSGWRAQDSSTTARTRVTRPTTSR